MKSKPDCIPCLVGRALRTARLITDDAWLTRKILNEVMSSLTRADLDRPPAELVSEVSREVARALGSTDPFAGTKEEHRKEAKALEDRFAKRIAESASPLGEALHLATLANALDASVFETRSIDSADHAELPPLALDDRARLAADLEGAATVLYVCDNAAEVLMDRFVIEQLRAAGKTVTVVVGRGAVVNDATLDDAEWSGVTAIEGVTVIASGNDGTGLTLSRVSAEVKEHFSSADVVIAKGSANLETVGRERDKAYFLLVAKCGVVARHLGVDIGDAVVVAE